MDSLVVFFFFSEAATLSVSLGTFFVIYSVYLFVDYEVYAIKLGRLMSRLMHTVNFPRVNWWLRLINV